MTLIKPNLDQLLGIRDTASSATTNEKPNSAKTNGSRSSGVMSLPTGAAITLLAALTTGTYTPPAIAEVPRNATEVSQLLSQLKGENGESTWDTRAGDFNNIPDKLVQNLSHAQKALFLEMGLKFAIDTYSSQAVKDTFTQKFGMAETVFNEKVKVAINSLVSDLEDEAKSEDSPIWDKHGDKFNSIQDWAVKLLDPPDLERFLKVGLINDFDTYSSQAVKDTFTQKFGMTAEAFDQTVTSIKGDSETGAEDGAGDGGKSADVANPAIQAELDTARTTIQQQNQTITTLQQQNQQLSTQLGEADLQIQTAQARLNQNHQETNKSNFHLPDWHMPDVQLPHLTTPDIHIPDLDLSGIHLPKDQKTRLELAVGAVGVSTLSAATAALIIKRRRKEALRDSFNENNEWKTAKDFFNQGQYSAAIKLFTKAIKVWPGDPESYHWRGDAHFLNKNYKEAAADYAKAIKLAKKSDTYTQTDLTLLHSSYGVALQKQGKHTAALKESGKAQILIEGSDDLGLNDIEKAKIYRDRGNALHKLNAAQRSSKIPKLAQLGRKYDPNLAYGKAIAMYKKALEINPFDIRSMFNLGTTYLAMGQQDQAITAFRKAKDTIRNDYDNAVQSYVQYRGRSPSDIMSDRIPTLELKIYLNRGAAHSDKQEFNQAITDYSHMMQKIKLMEDQGITVDTELKQSALSNRSLAYAAQGNFQQAQEDARMLLSINPKSKDIIRLNNFLEAAAQGNGRFQAFAKDDEMLLTYIPNNVKPTVFDQARLQYSIKFRGFAPIEADRA